MPRADNRAANQLRPLHIRLDAYGYGEGVALIEQGETRVLCAASVEEGVPPFLRGQGQGWVSGEYSLLPRATTTRNRRERNGASGRTQEIQRLIGRALRVAVDLKQLGEYTITIDCDVLQADGGTRCAAITGGYVALALACRRMVEKGALAASPIVQQVAAISCGYLGGVALLDLDYSEDSNADMDCNVVQTASGSIVEIQCTAEKQAITRPQLDQLLDLAGAGIGELLAAQLSVLG